MVSDRARRNDRSQAQGVAMLVFVTAIWGTTFPLVKTLGETLPSEAIVAARFTIGAAVFIPWLRGIDHVRLVHGALLGFMAFASYATQTIGLRSVSSGQAAFVTGLNVIMVPLALPLLGRGLSRIAVASAALAVTGIALLSWDEGAVRLGVGDLWMLACAGAYAAYVLLLERFAPQHRVMDLTAVQVSTVGVCGIVWALTANRSASIDSLRQANLGTWTTIAYLAIVGVSLTMLLQTKAQKVVAAPVAVVVYSFEPGFGAAASYVWRDERLAPLGFLGATFVVAAMILSQRRPQRELSTESGTESGRYPAELTDRIGDDFGHRSN